MLNTEQILEQNGLNWNVVKRPLFYSGTANAPDGDFYSTDYYGIVREDTGEVFTTVSETYEPTQNHTIIETMQEIAEDNELDIVKAMPLNGGRKIVVQIWYPAEAKSDSLYPYMDNADIRLNALSDQVGVPKGLISQIKKIG